MISVKFGQIPCRLYALLTVGRPGADRTMTSFPFSSSFHEPRPRPSRRSVVPFTAALLSAALASILSSSCASDIGRKDKLATALIAFNQSVRWQRHKDAEVFLVGPIKEAYMDAVEETDEDVKVSEVELLRVVYRKKGSWALVRYRYRWHVSSEMILHKGVFVQHWKWKKGAWRLFRVKQVTGPPFPYFEMKAKKKRSAKGKKKAPKNNTEAPKDKKDKTKETPKENPR